LDPSIKGTFPLCHDFKLNNIATNMSDFPERNINEYYASLKRAIQQENSTELCRLISIDLAHRPSFIRLLHHHNSSREALDGSNWHLIVDMNLRAIRYIHESNLQEAFNEKANSSNEFLKIFQAQKETNWCIGFMNKHSVDLRRLALKADADADIKRAAELARAKGGDGSNLPKSTVRLIKKDENMERACDCLMQLFRVCATDTRSAYQNSKRKGMIYVINQLFKAYFRINKLHLCKPLIRALDNANIFDQCSLAQRVTYNYYLGVKTLFDLRIVEAEKLLDFVFANCHPKSKNNIRLTLIFLIPIKMLLGRMPSKELLEKYDLLQFNDIKKALISGRVGDLDNAIETHSDFLWRYGIYLIIERLRPITLRNLLKRVAKLADSHLVDLNMILNAVRMVQPEEEVKIEEVHCLLSNLIYEGKVKGYLSIAHQKLVLSKTNPFPPIAELAR